MLWFLIVTSKDAGCIFFSTKTVPKAYSERSRTSERQRLPKACKGVIFRNFAAKTKKYCLRNFWEKLYWEMIFFTVIFVKFCKKFRTRDVVKKLFMKILQYSQESTCAGVSF